MGGVRENSAGWALAALTAIGVGACGSDAKSSGGGAGSNAGGALGIAGASAGTGGAGAGTSAAGGRTDAAMGGTAGTTHSGGTGAGGRGMGGSGGAPMRPVAPALPAGWLRSEFKPPQGQSGQPYAVIDSKGAAYVVATSGSGVWLAKLDAKGWGTPQSLSDVNGPSIAIAIDAQDRGIAVWSAGAQDTASARTATYDPQGGWIMGGAIGTAPTFPSELDLALSKNGSALVVWLEGNDQAAFIRGAQLTGKVWSAPVEIAPSGFAELVRPALGIDDQGHGAVIWRHSDDGVLKTSCHGSTFDGQIWSPPTRVGGTADGCYLPDFAMLGNGDGVAVYETDANVTALSYTVAGGFGADKLISNSIPDTSYVAMPSLELNATGQGLVAFRESATKDAPFSPFFNSYKSGTGWGQATLITGSIGDMEPSAKVGVNASGQGVVTWTMTDHTSGYRAVYASLYSPQTGFAPAILLDAGLDAAGGVRMAADINDAGNIVVAWDRRDDAGDHAMAAYYAAP